MTSSFTVSGSETFTITHARHLAAKVATDLKRMQRFYGRPSDIQIAEYEVEAAVLLKGGYLNTVSYGFRRGGAWIEPTLRYAARDLSGFGGSDDDPGRVRPGADVAGAAFYSYLVRTEAWWRLTEAERQAVEAGLPFSRDGATEPAVEGYLARDLTYSSGGRALERSTVRSFR